MRLYCDLLRGGIVACWKIIPATDATTKAFSDG
jgi:hypothetical protein